MPIPLSRCPLRQSVALIGGTVLFAVTLLAAAFAAPAPTSETPKQVAETLDSIVQPRFQKNAGQFGASRVFALDGHGDVHWVDANSRSERARFAAIKASHRPYIIAFLHCRHKPGAHVDPPTKPDASDLMPPSVNTLTAVGATQIGADRMSYWADKSLFPVVRPHFAALIQGQPAEVNYENWVVVMRPIRALHQACITCHVGTKRGDTLGVMVYAVDKNQKITGQDFVAGGGGG